MEAGGNFAAWSMLCAVKFIKASWSVCWSVEENLVGSETVSTSDVWSYKQWFKYYVWSKMHIWDVLYLKTSFG